MGGQRLSVGVTGSGGGTARDAGADGSDGNLVARDTGPGRIDQQPAVDTGEPLSCNGLLTFGGHAPLSDSGSRFYAFPNFVAAGDVNGDGKLDLVTAEHTTGTVSVLLGNGDGILRAPAGCATGSPYSDDGNWPVGPSTVALGDVNGDGKPDIVTVGQTRENVGWLGVLRGNGDGTLVGGVDGVLPGEPGLVRLADVNGDGRLDIVTASRDLTTPSVLPGNAGGTFTAVEPDSETQARGLGLGDVDDDGKLDLVVVGFDLATGAGSATVLRGRGDGNLTAANVVAVCDGPAAVALGDVNGDGRLDMAVACDED